MGAQNFAPKFPQNWGFQPQNLHLRPKIFQPYSKTNFFQQFSDSSKFRGIAPPPPTTPLLRNILFLHVESQRHAIFSCLSVLPLSSDLWAVKVKVN